MWGASNAAMPIARSRRRMPHSSERNCSAAKLASVFACGVLLRLVIQAGMPLDLVATALPRGQISPSRGAMIGSTTLLRSGRQTRPIVASTKDGKASAPAGSVSNEELAAAAVDDAELEDPALMALAMAEEENEDVAMAMASDEDMADSIVAEAVSAFSSDPETKMIEEEEQKEKEKEEEEEQAVQAVEEGKALPAPPVYDLESLCVKYGGKQQLCDDFGVAADLGYFMQLDELKKWLFDYVDKHTQTAKQSFVEFEHDRGSRLVLVGTNHLSRDSSDFAREVVQKEKPECLVLERRLGDDSLQRFTVPEEMYQEMAMGSSPSVLLSSDSPIDRARKFMADRVWLEATPGWRDIGGEASLCQEFGAALAEFARQRLPGGTTPGGPRGGTVCLGDSDLRAIPSKGLKPGLGELGMGGCMPLRDLQLAQALRAALRTHGRVVGVVGKDHLGGIARLLRQDPRIRVTKEGLPVEQPSWQKELEEGGKKWEREAMGGSALFNTLAEAAEKTPFGTFLSGDAVRELYALREETAARLRRDGADALPAAPVSSELGAELFRQGRAYTPPDEDSLRRWLAGESMEAQEAGEFPFENRRLREKPPPLPSSGFPEPAPPAE